MNAALACRWFAALFNACAFRTACLLAICIFLNRSLAANPPADVVIVGAGVAGLSAALEAARAGFQVTVIDMSSVGGGHAIVSNGAICIVKTPLQQRRGVSDSFGLAKKDFLQRGEDANPQWVDLYVRQSKTWIYDWLSNLGVTFYDLGQPPGNSVPRLHFARDKGWGLVGPLLRECLRYPNIHFLWSTKVERLLTSEGKIVGVAAVNLRTNEHNTFRGNNVILATGGFGSNLELIRKYWPADLPTPERLLAGASPSALGSGMEMARDAGGVLSRLDHQWNYVLGFPDPEDRQGTRGLASFDARSIWVNREGKRFTHEFGDPKNNLAALLHQTDKTYWSVFDADGVNSFSITLAGWEDQAEVNKLVFQASGTVLAPNLKELGIKAGISAEGLAETVDRYNRFVLQGDDEDLHVFGPNTTPRRHSIEKPPFYAVQFFPITRKTMGGVSVDLQCRVLNQAGTPVPGLLAAGEVTGFGGINGKAALEGTFLGPGIFMGRAAARAATSNAHKTRNAKLRSLPSRIPPAAFSNSACTDCHSLSKAVEENRPGFWHFEQSHKKVLDRQYRCAQCHQIFYPFKRDEHRLDPLALTDSCVTCHGVQSSRAN